MVRKNLHIFVPILCLGLILIGCPKKTVVKEEPSIKKEAVPTREMKPKEEQWNTTLLLERDELITQKSISPLLVFLQIVSPQSAMGRRGLWTLAIMKKHGPETEGLTL